LDCQSAGWLDPSQFGDKDEEVGGLKYINHSAENGSEWQPNAQLMAMAELLANPEDRRSKSEKMKEASLPERTYYRWMKDQRYIDYVNSLIEKYTDSELPEIWRALVRKCKAGDVSAIKLLFELRNMYNKKLQITRKSDEVMHIYVDYGQEVKK
jgi:hypothetical protein